MADDGNDDGMSPIDLGALGLLGMRGAAGAASLFRSAAPYMGRGVGMLSRGGAGPAGLGAAAMYEIAKPTPANAGETAQYVRGPDGQMVPNPKADRSGLQSGQAGVDMADNTLPQPSPATPASGAQVAQQDGGDPWMGKGAFSLASDPGAMVRGTAVPANDMSARGGRAAGVGSGGSSRGGVTSDSQITGRASPGSGGSFLGSFGDKIKQHSNLLLGLGAGLSGKASFGQAMSGGFAGAATGNQADVTQNMTQGGIRAGYQYLVNAGIDPNQALAAVYNPELYKTLIGQLNPEPKIVDGGQNRDGSKRSVMQIGGHIVSLDLAAQPTPVHTFEEALRLPKGVPFSLPDGRMGIR